jgi:DNA-binding CsgD family transcriptional regulator
MKGTPIEPKPPGFNLQSLILNHPAHPKQARAYRRLKLVQPHERLNPREAQVADLLAEGWNPGRAADFLGLSLEQLVYFSRRIRRKLGIEGRTDLSLWELGFGDPGRPPKGRKQGGL